MDTYCVKLSDDQLEWKHEGIALNPSAVISAAASLYTPLAQ